MTMPHKQLLCDGLVLSAAFRQIYDEACDADGLLFGAVQQRTVKVISDTVSDQSARESTAVLQYIHVAHSPWHDHMGTVDPAALAQLSADHSPMRLIGWFSSRLNSSFRASVRETAIHSSLVEWHRANGGGEGGLVFGIMSGCHSDAGHIMTQDFRAFMGSGSADMTSPTNALPTIFRNLGRSTQFEFSAFEPSCSAPNDLPRMDERSAHPLDAYVETAIVQLEADAVGCSDLMQQVSVEHAELAQLQARIEEQHKILREITPTKPTTPL
eukprot:TRINITY_DN11386_c0_g1_i1.p1 TRINITY_DN11386_c0_g1~~TRINITY_DN11386_c0_g1_i1.p1  ORF type:complete len:270 (-),score=39.72 TRINITY_DN11386_c0_g1_i1:345-1154(-)